MLVRRIILQKLSARNLQAEKVQKQLDYLKHRVLQTSRVNKGWKAFLSPVTHNDVNIPIPVEDTRLDEEVSSEVAVAHDEPSVENTKNNTTNEKKEVKAFLHSYTVNLEVVNVPKKRRNEEIVEGEFTHIVDMVTKACKSKGWKVQETETLDKDYVLPEDIVETKAVDNTNNKKEEGVIVENGTVVYVPPKEETTSTVTEILKNAEESLAVIS